MLEAQLTVLAKQLPVVQRLLRIPGVGLMIATAQAGFVSDLRRFPSARHLERYLA